MYQKEQRESNTSMRDSSNCELSNKDNIINNSNDNNNNSSSIINNIDNISSHGHGNGEN